MRIQLSLLIVSSLFFSLLVNSEQQVIDCESVKVNYEKITTEINQSCELGTKCAIAGVNWDPCSSAIAHNDQEHVTQLTTHRKELHQICNFKEESCVDIPTEAFCYNRMCRTRTELESIEPLDIKLKLVSAGTPLASKVIQVMIDTGIRCISAPCPSSKEILSLLTDDQGILVFNQESIFHVLDELRFSPDGTTLRIDGYGFANLNLKSLLVDATKVVEINFVKQVQ